MMQWNEPTVNIETHIVRDDFQQLVTLAHMERDSESQREVLANRKNAEWYQNNWDHTLSLLIKRKLEKESEAA